MKIVKHLLTGPNCSGHSCYLCKSLCTAAVVFGLSMGAGAAAGGRQVTNAGRFRHYGASCS